MVKDIFWNIFPKNTKLTVHIYIMICPFQQRKIHRQGNMTFHLSAVFCIKFRGEEGNIPPTISVNVVSGKEEASNTIMQRWCQSEWEISWKTQIELKPESLRRKQKIRNLWPMKNRTETKQINNSQSKTAYKLEQSIWITRKPKLRIKT